jgi:DNA ligase (NAD+)
VQFKLDGISIELQYLNGRLHRGVTRGNGIIGDNITANVLKMKSVPHTIPNQFTGAVRGEIIMFHEIFQAKYSDQKNCRNTAAGIAKRKDGRGAEDLTIISYDAKNLTSPFQDEKTKISWLAQNQFHTVGTQFLDTIEKVVQYRQEVIDDRREKLDYDIDGLVIKGNRIDWIDMERERPKNQIAFKFPPDQIITTLKDAEWSESGATYTPVAIVEPVEIAGTTVQRASLANPGLIENLKLKIGSKVVIVKRGEIIPKIIKVIDTPPSATAIEIPTTCSTCLTSLVNESTKLYCPNDLCEKRQFHRLQKWLSSLEIKHFGDKLLEQLFSIGKVITIADLYTVSIRDIAILSRQGEKSAERALSNLSKVSELSLAKFIGGFDIEGIGSTLIDLLVKAGFDTLDKLANAPISQLEKVNKIGEITAHRLQEGIKKLSSEMQAVLATKKIHIHQTAPQTSGIFRNLSFCFTGKLNTITRNDAKELVLSNGGQFKSGVTKSITYLITNTPDSGSSKNIKAKDLGVKIITEAQFLDLLE